MKLKKIINNNLRYFEKLSKPVVKFQKEDIVEQEYTTTYRISKNNSTRFTRCCSCAVTDKDTVCPECKKIIYK